MKKYILSLGVILIFAGYIFYSKHDDEKINVIAPPGLMTTTTASSSTADTSGSGTTPPTQTTPPPTSTPTPRPQGQYKDGSYTGNVADAYFGNLQVQAVVSGGKITDVIFLQYPNDRGESKQINSQAMPYLKAEAIQAQNANVNIVSGATQSSHAFIESLGNALSQAKI